MKLPRISLLTLMAVVVVVALDGAAFRLIASRPDFLSDRVWFAAMLTLPMANLLAIVAAIRSSRRGSWRAFLLGFELAGWAAVAASFAWRETILTFLDWGLESTLPASWMSWINRTRAGLLVAYAGVFGAYFLLQGLVAAAAGLVARWASARLARTPGPVAESLTPRPRVAALAWMVAMVAVPVAVIEGYLRVTVDPMLNAPHIARLRPGSTAVVDLHKVQMIPTLLIPPGPSPLAKLDGTRVRVDSDAAPWQFEVFETGAPPGGTRILRDQRAVKVFLLDGPRKGELISLPHYVVRPLP